MEFNIDLDDLTLEDLGDFFNPKFNNSELFLGHFSPIDVENLLYEANIIQSIQSMGYDQWYLDVHAQSEVDNRIYIKTNDNKILVFMRLKLSDYLLPGNYTSKKFLFIDWLVTQNIKRPKLNMFSGQVYPGLGVRVMLAIRAFFNLILNKTKAYGFVFFPEYFHDAVLFQRFFRSQFIKPCEAALFKNIQISFPNSSLKMLSRAIHDKRIILKSSKEKLIWKNMEMVNIRDEALSELTFNSNYYNLLQKAIHANRFSFIDSLDTKQVELNLNELSLAGH